MFISSNTLNQKQQKMWNSCVSSRSRSEFYLWQGFQPLWLRCCVCPRFLQKICNIHFHRLFFFDLQIFTSTNRVCYYRRVTTLFNSVFYTRWLLTRRLRKLGSGIIYVKRNATNFSNHRKRQKDIKFMLFIYIFYDCRDM